MLTKRQFLVVAMASLLCGCGATPSGTGTSGASGMSGQMPATSSIPEGIYAGNATATYRASAGGQSQEQSETDVISSTINADGLPVAPNGGALRVGLVINEQAGAFARTIRVTSVDVSGNRIAWSYSVNMNFAGHGLTGMGSVLLTFHPPDTLDLHDTYSAASFDSVPVTLRSTLTATLTK